MSFINNLSLTLRTKNKKRTITCEGKLKKIQVVSYIKVADARSVARTRTTQLKKTHSYEIGKYFVRRTRQQAARSRSCITDERMNFDWLKFYDVPKGPQT